MFKRNKKPGIWVRENNGITGEIDYEGTRLSKYNDGYALTYVNIDGREDVVFYSHRYRPYYTREGYPVIFKKAGNNSACSWVGYPLDADCPGDDYSLLLRTHLEAQKVKTLKEPEFPIKWVIIGVVIIVAIIAMVIMFKQSQPKTSVQPTISIEQNK